MITAHGASERRLSETRVNGRTWWKPPARWSISRIAALQKLVREGFHPVIIGKRDHVEVRGLTGDLGEFDVVLSEADMAQSARTPALWRHGRKPHSPLRKFVGWWQFPPAISESEVRFIDTVCQPTKLRQNAAIELAQQCDVVIVIGGAHSNNTRQLVDTCCRLCPRVYHVQTADDLRAEWFQAQKGGHHRRNLNAGRGGDGVENWLGVRCT